MEICGYSTANINVERPIKRALSSLMFMFMFVLLLHNRSMQHQVLTQTVLSE